MVGQGELVRTDPRFVDLQTRTQHVDELYQMVADIIATRTTAEWLVALEEIDVPVMPVHTIEELLHDPHLKAIDFFQAVEHETEGPVVSMAVPSSWSRSQPQPSRLAARLGQHSAEILREIGFGEAEIAALTGDSATGKAASPAQPDIRGARHRATATTARRPSRLLIRCKAHSCARRFSSTPAGNLAFMRCAST